MTEQAKAASQKAQPTKAEIEAENELLRQSIAAADKEVENANARVEELKQENARLKNALRRAGISVKE